MKKKELVSIATWLTVATIIGKILGFCKDILISYYYGSSEITDALFISMAIPTIILGVFTSASDSAVIPQYLRIKSDESRLVADSHFSYVTNSLVGISLIISIIIFLFPDFFVSVFAPGFNKVQQNYAFRFTRMFSFFGMMHIIYCFFCSYNTIYKSVVVRSILAFLTNVIVCMSLIIYPDKEMYALTLAFVLAFLFNAILPVISAYKLKYRHKLLIDYKNQEFKKFTKIFMPIVGAALIAKLNIFVDGFIASNFGSGCVSSLAYANKLTNIFDTMIVVGIGVVILPLMAGYSKNSDFKKFIETAVMIIKILIMALLPFAIVFFMLNEDIVRVVYMRGEFGVENVKVVSEILRFYSPLILLLSFQAIMIRFYHSMENTKFPFFVTTIGVILNIIASVILSKFIGLKGVALATSLALFFNSIIFIIAFRYKIGWDKSKLNFIDLAKYLFVIMILYGINLLIKHQNFDLNMYTQLLLKGSIIFIAYILMLIVLFKKDLTVVYNLIKN